MRGDHPDIEVADLLSATPDVESNVEGNPFPQFMNIVRV